MGSFSGEKAMIGGLSDLPRVVNHRCFPEEFFASTCSLVTSLVTSLATSSLVNHGCFQEEFFASTSSFLSRETIRNCGSVFALISVVGILVEVGEGGFEVGVGDREFKVGVGDLVRAITS